MSSSVCYELRVFMDTGPESLAHIDADKRRGLALYHRA